jgi:hypothetical protein
MALRHASSWNDFGTKRHSFSHPLACSSDLRAPVGTHEAKTSIIKYLQSKE